MSTFAISNAVHSADNIVTLADLHNSKYDLNSNTKISFGKLYSPTTRSSNANNYSLTAEDNNLSVAAFQKWSKRDYKYSSIINKHKYGF